MSFFRNGGFIMIDTTSFLFFARRMMITDKQPNLIWGFKFGYKHAIFDFDQGISRPAELLSSVSKAVK